MAIKEKLATLAGRVKADVSSVEKIRLEMRVEGLDKPTKDAIQRSIASVLDVENDIVVRSLGQHSDSDRIIEEIISELESSAGDN